MIGSATKRLSRSHPTDHSAASLNVGWRLRAKTSRSTSSSATTAARTPAIARGLSTTANGIGKLLGDEERDREHEVDSEQLEALEPGRLALVGDVVGDH